MKKVNEIVWTIIVAVCGFWAYDMLYRLVGNLMLWKTHPVAQVYGFNFIEYVQHYQEGILITVSNLVVALIFVVIGVIILVKGSKKSEG